MWTRLLPTILILASVGCSGADSGPVFTADEVPSPTPLPTTQLIVPLTTVAIGDEPVPEGIVFGQISVLDPGRVEIVGTGAVSTDPVTVDDRPAEFLAFESTIEGGFVATVPIPETGTHTVCIAASCEAVDGDV